MMSVSGTRMDLKQAFRKQDKVTKKTHVIEIVVVGRADRSQADRIVKTI